MTEKEKAYNFLKSLAVDIDDNGLYVLTLLDVKKIVYALIDNKNLLKQQNTELQARIKEIEKEYQEFVG